MNTNHSHEQWSSGRGQSHRLSAHQAPQDASAYRGHLPPPFYNAKDEDLLGRRYPSEGRSSQHMPEDIGNYGRGGYYGHTYDQENINRARNMAQEHPNPIGQRDSYRHLGDRRWPDAGQTSWEIEHPLRGGYSSMRERFQMAGMHRGKGPRSYRRSDNRILEELNDRLHDDPYLDASEIETEVQDGEIVLLGTVETRQAKRRAEDIAEMISGVRNVENRLRVPRLHERRGEPPLIA